MPDAQTLDCIDIREAVYFRMAPREVRDQVKVRGSVTEEIEAKILARMFPAMREEALLWYRAGKGRGIVLCEGLSITYVPFRRLSDFLRTAGHGSLSKAKAAVESYDPHHEAVIGVVRGEFRRIAVIGPNAGDDPILQLIQ